MVGAGAPATVAGGISLARDSRGGVLLSERTNSIAVERGTTPLSEVQADLLVICLRGVENSESKESEESTPYELPPVIAKFDTSGALKDAIDDADFRGARGKSTEVVRVAGAPARRVIVYGLGAAEGIENAVRGATEFAVGKAKDIKGDVRLAVYVDGEMTSAMVTSATEGAAIGAYTDDRYREKKDNGKKPPEKLVLVGEEISGISEPEFSSAVKRGLVFAAGILTTKEVVAAPANCLTPKALAEAARTVAEETGLEVKVLGREECEKLGMGCYLGVSQGSSTEPQFIHMTYTPQGGSPAKKVALVGKAVTFDSGGYNLKAGPGSMIELMKWDMGGSGAVLGAARVIGEVKPSNVEVHFIMPACENMVSDHAIHPGDILKASNGKTVEVMNTDAEGRLCLADALVYAENLGDLDYVVDIATLTGAIIVSLGHDVAGFWSSSDDLADELLAAGKKSGEKLWRMPLVDEYAEQLKSKISDLKNIGAGRAGSSIIAALFLKEFVKTKNWSHIDIAGTAWADKKGGATGFGVKTLAHWVEGISAQASK